MQKHFLPILFITFLISFFSLCLLVPTEYAYPDIEQYTIDTLMTPTDTAGYIYGRIYENQSEQGRIFEAYAANNLLKW